MILGRTINYRGMRNPTAAHRARRRSSPTQRLINALFSEGQQGVFYVPQPVVDGQQVLFTDAAGTIPVTADGDPAGLMLDLSGNGNHASQSVSLSRPKYRTDGTLHWLEGDGVDDGLYHGLGMTGEITAIVAAELLDLAEIIQGLMFFTAPNTRLHGGIWGSVSNSNNWGCYADSWSPSSTSLLNNKAVITNIGNGNLESQQLYTNGNPDGEFSGIYEGDLRDRRVILREHTDGRPAHARFFGAVAIGGLADDVNRQSAENYLATRAGITL